MKNNFSALLKDRRIRTISWMNGLTLIVFLIISIWRWSLLPLQLPLFFSLPRGTNQLGNPVEIFLLPLFAVIFSTINYYIASILYAEERLAAIFLTVISLTASFLLLVTFAKIIFLVT